MPKKQKHRYKAQDEKLWISPKSILKGPAGERAWDNRTGGPPSNSKYLEFADIALGTKKTSPRKNSLPIHDATKTEPYSQK